MHVLILNHHPLQAKFLQKGFRYENIGSDFCHPDNLTKIWYNQYDALIVPIKTWEFPPIKSFLEILKSLGNVPIFITHQIPPPKNLAPSFAELPSLRLIGTHTPFLHLLQKLKNLKSSTQSTLPHDTHIQIENLSINLATREVRREGKSRYLRNKEFSLLECLMRNANKALTRTYLLEKAWDHNTTILSNTVDVHINRLRHKVDTGFSHQMIVTIPCTGYKLQTRKNSKDT